MRSRVLRITLGAILLAAAAAAAAFLVHSEQTLATARAELRPVDQRARETAEDTIDREGAHAISVRVKRRRISPPRGRRSRHTWRPDRDWTTGLHAPRPRSTRRAPGS